MGCRVKVRVGKLPLEKGNEDEMMSPERDRRVIRNRMPSLMETKLRLARPRIPHDLNRPTAKLLRKDNDRHGYQPSRARETC